MNDRVMIAGVSSGCGKTSITCALLNALAPQGVSAFKCGPDYIDPMFHNIAAGGYSRNLDTFLFGADNVRYLLGKHGKDRLSIIEGVMGFYDGLGGVSTSASSYDISMATDTPVILAASCKVPALSLSEELRGYKDKMPNNIKGVILNYISEDAYPAYRDVIQKHSGLKVFGHMLHMEGAEIESRHLGLSTAGEESGISSKIAILGQAASRYIDIEAIRTVASSAGELYYKEPDIKHMGGCKIGVAKDSAFSFYYRDNMELLEMLGAEIIYFSPLKDKSLPADIDALIFGGGYPELYLEGLSSNTSMINDIRRVVSDSIPVIAECGGFMYLQRSISGYSTLRVFNGDSYMTSKLIRFGYVTLTALHDNMLLKKGETINAHEFHYSDSTDNGSSYSAKKPVTGVEWPCIKANDNIFAGYPHIHFYGNPDTARNFITAALKYRNTKRHA